MRQQPPMCCSAYHLCSFPSRVQGSPRSLVTMWILLPSLDFRIFFTKFPTWTPEWFAGCLRICPVFLSFGFVKWCVAHDVPSTFNLPLAAEALQLPTRETLLPNAKIILAFFKDNHSFFDASMVQAVGAQAVGALVDFGTVVLLGVIVLSSQ
jgi:hypothetical protein